MFDGAKRKTTLGPQTSECKVKNKQTNKQTKKKKENSTIPLFDTDLFYFPLVDVITGSMFLRYIFKRSVLDLLNRIFFKHKITNCPNNRTL